MINYFKKEHNVIRMDDASGLASEILMDKITLTDGTSVLVKSLLNHAPGWAVPEGYAAAHQTDWEYACVKLKAWIQSLP